MIRETLAAALATWREEARRAAAVRELRALPDPQLADLGIGRGEIEAYVRGRAGPLPVRRPALRLVGGAPARLRPA